MNKRIKELAEQADVYIDQLNCAVTGNGTELISEHIEKFAELLINECIRIVEGASDQYSGPVWADELINVMVEYFGVEQ